jgi:NAD-dependent SIR2 family protein deacetylase
MGKQPNGTTVPEIRHDEHGNLISCPECKSKKIKKDGFQYWKNNRRRQRWQCNSCYKKFLNPNIDEKAEGFEVQPIPVDEMDIEDIIKYRNKKYERKILSKRSKNLINIDVKVDGVIGICHFGDPHVDDDGTNLAEIFDH